MIIQKKMEKIIFIKKKNIYEDYNQNKLDYLKNEKFNKIFIVKLIFYIFVFFIFFMIYKSKKEISPLKEIKKFINDCKRFIRYNNKENNNCQNPFLSICLSAFNMENYIERNILSIINQSFQDFEIILVNDNSNDNTGSIIKRMQLEDERIKIINHSKNLGVYKSRIEAILNAKGTYIIIMDPDDMFLNKNLFYKLYNYNLEFNLDIIEFSVYRQIEGEKTMFFPNNHFENHYHNFDKQIIYQPDLSNLLYYLPETGDYSHTICRNIWNKMIKKKIFLDLHKYIGNDYFNEYVITSDDMLMNIVAYQFAQNYSNINFPGYLYIIREISMSHGDGGITLMKIRTINYLLYFQMFYKYIKDFNKDRNYLFYEMKNLNHFIINIKEYNMTEYIPKQIKFFKEIIKDKSTSYGFRKYVENLLLLFQ